jgi:ADP-ribose pyrophosphatase
MPKTYTLDKLTDCHWANLYQVRFQRKSQTQDSWIMCSRKDKPIANAHQADAVVIVPTIDTDQGRKLVITKEFRIPIWDYEYGFPAGLIDPGEDVEATIARELKEETGLDLVRIRHISTPVFSSAGLTDESCNMALVEAQGTVSTQWQEQSEDIETILLDVDGIRDLLASSKKIAAKAWGMLYHYAQTGKID